MSSPPADSSRRLPWGTLKVSLILLTGVTAILYVANLPYPIIRRPVARHASFLLLPSFVNMERNYRQVTDLVQQSDQLINRATTPEDLTLGEQKLKAAAQSLDALPIQIADYDNSVWYGGRVTYDQFQGTREQVARMQAKLVQEQQALKLLQQGEQTLNSARQQAQQAATPADRATAFTAWRSALASLGQVAEGTLARRILAPKLPIYQQELDQAGGSLVTGGRSQALIQAAQEFANSAARLSQNPPHPADQWAQAADLWQQASQRLQQIADSDPAYPEAQKLLVEYQVNLGTIRRRQAAEQAAVQALQQTQQAIQQLVAETPNLNRSQVISRLQSILTQLKTIQPGTTAYAEAQKLTQDGQRKLKALQAGG